MNPNLARLQPYPFDKLRALLADGMPGESRRPINLSIGEPRHAAPDLIRTALTSGLDGLSNYPLTRGSLDLRRAIAEWIRMRYAPATVDPETQVLPVNGSREALFAIAQVVVDPGPGDARVICPNPFYQIYEGAALLSGASPWYLSCDAASRYAPDYRTVPEEVWKRTQLVYVCSPSNPAGRVTPLDEWRILFELSDRYGFVIASDECYSELYPDESAPPLGALAASASLGRADLRRLLVFSSLSKRSNVPGLRSGFVSGDAALVRSFLLYRTYHGGAMSPAVQAASIAAWRDEEHVRENRRLYREKFAATRTPMAELGAAVPEGGFYYWLPVPTADTRFAQDLHRFYNVTVLPGSFLARDVNDRNPGRNHVRVALVAPLEECIEAVQRIVEFRNSISPT